MPRPFRPGFWFTEDYREKSKWISRPTFRELMKILPEYIKNSDENQITTFRTRRGEWGEFYEKWELSNNKLVCVKKGWM